MSNGHDTRPAHEFLGDWDGQLIATALHAGHDLRDDTRAVMILDEQERLREEDPHTERIGARIPARVVVNRSRFEVDLNRPRDEAVYRRPEDCWELEVWRDNPLGDEIVERSLRQYDAFFTDLGERLDRVAERGPFVVYDVHSYNHRRDGADADEASYVDNPEVNLGTGTVERAVWAPVVDAFTDALRGVETSTGPLDVRENVRFRGRKLAWWVHERYPGRGCVLAIEFKKTFMDEWTGTADEARVAELADALAATADPVLAALRTIRG